MARTTPRSCPPVEDRVAAWKRFYRRENGRPLLGFFLGSEYPIPRYAHAAALPDDRPVVPDDLDPRAHARDEAALFEAHEACGGDFIHAGSAYWGVPWCEAILGAEIRASHETGSLYAETIGGDREVPVFDEGAPWVAKAGAMLDALARTAAGRFPLATTRMRGVADLLVTLYGTEHLITAMIEAPDEVHEKADALADLSVAFARYQLERIPDFHDGVGSFYYSMWAPAGTVWHQEDSSMLLSPDLYDEFIRPRVERIFAAFRHNIMHFHSTGGYLPVAPVLGMKPTAVELHRDSGGPSAQELFPRHREILAAAPLLIWGALDRDDLDWVFTKLPPEGLAVQVAVESVDEAQEILSRYGGSDA